MVDHFTVWKGRRALLRICHSFYAYLLIYGYRKWCTADLLQFLFCYWEAAEGPAAFHDQAGVFPDSAGTDSTTVFRDRRNPLCWTYRRRYRIPCLRCPGFSGDEEDAAGGSRRRLNEKADPPLDPLSLLCRWIFITQQPVRRLILFNLWKPSHRLKKPIITLIIITHRYLA